MNYNDVYFTKEYEGKEQQLELQLKYKNQLNVIGKLTRSSIPITSKVIQDEATKKINEFFDFDFNGENMFYPFEFNDILKKLDFSILCIVGASGVGKSTFAKYYGKDEKLDWDNNKCILSNIDENVNTAIEKLTATGLNSIPTWTKPYYVLSVGEKFRASLARKLKSNCVIDEFTSNVDRTVALSCSASISKYIRKNNLKKCVFISCHKDFIDVLCPDYILDLDDAVIYDAKGLARRKFELSIYEKTNKNEIWQLFKRHHYLSAELNEASKCFVAYLFDEPVACCFILSQPGIPNNKYCYRIHRLVVLPDYQGLGIATKFLEYLCDIYTYHKKTIYLRTSHIKLIEYMKKSNKWKGDGKLKHSTAETMRKNINFERLSTSFKYIGGCSYNKNYNYKNIYFPNNIINKTKQISLEDLI